MTEDMDMDLRLVHITGGMLRRFEALEIAVGKMLETPGDPEAWLRAIAAVRDAYNDLQ